MASIRSYFFCILGAMVAATSACAMTVAPIHVEMSSVGQSALQTVTVGNTNTTVPMAFEVKVEQLHIAENGSRKTSPAPNALQIQPPQAIVPPGGKQVVRLRWAGDPAMPVSSTYLVTVVEIPLKPKEGTKSVTLTTNFGIVLNVAPPAAMHDVKVVKSALVSEGGQRRVALTLSNTGRRHALLQDASVTFKSGTWSANKSGAEIARDVGIGILQPGTQRTFVFKSVVPPTSQGPISATVEFAKAAN